MRALRRCAKPYDLPGLTLLERLLRFHRLTLRQAEAKTGVPRSTLARIAKGQWPDVRVALRLARIFDVKVEDLWGDAAWTGMPTRRSPTVQPKKSST